jgi:hypothetical protein
MLSGSAAQHPPIRQIRPTKAREAMAGSIRAGGTGAWCLTGKEPA